LRANSLLFQITAENRTLVLSVDMENVTSKFKMSDFVVLLIRILVPLNIYAFPGKNHTFPIRSNYADRESTPSKAKVDEKTPSHINFRRRWRAMTFTNEK